MKDKSCRFCEGAGWLCDECDVPAQIDNLLNDSLMVSAANLREFAKALSGLSKATSISEQALTGIAKTATGKFIETEEVSKKLRKIIKQHNPYSFRNRIKFFIRNIWRRKK